jgi:hypothetical protein
MPLGLLMLACAFISLVTELPDAIGDCVLIAGALGLFAGIVTTGLGHSMGKSIGISLVGVTFAEVVHAIAIRGLDAKARLAWTAPFAVVGFLVGVGIVEGMRWVAESPPKRELAWRPVWIGHVPRRARMIVPEPLHSESPVDRTWVRASFAVVLSLLAPVATAAVGLSLIRRDAIVDSTIAIVVSGASLSFICAEWLQLRAVAARTAAVVMGLVIASSTLTGIVIDRRFFDGMLGLATAGGSMVPAAMIFAAIAGWFCSTGLRVIAAGSPVLGFVAREEHFVDEEEPVSDEVLPSSTRRLLERVRTQRKK